MVVIPFAKIDECSSNATKYANGLPMSPKYCLSDSMEKGAGTSFRTHAQSRIDRLWRIWEMLSKACTKKLKVTEDYGSIVNEDQESQNISC